MRLDRNRFNDLFVECDSASRAMHDRQQLVIEPFSPAKPASGWIEGYTWNQNQVQPVRWNGDAMTARLANAELAAADVVGDVLNLTGDITFCSGVEAGQGDGFAGGEGIAEERPDIQFLGQW